MQRFKKLMFFGAAGIFGFMADAGVTLLLQASLGAYLARLPGFIAAATITWLINRRFTFADSTSGYDHIYKEYLHYLSLMIFGLIVNYVTYLGVVTVFHGSHWAVLAGIAAGSIGGMLVNFFNAQKFLYSSPRS
jgi:putative flippase GtrA